MSDARQGEGRIDDAGDVPVLLGLQRDEGPCVYLPGRTATHEAYFVRRLAPAHYEGLMGAGFRRSGLTVYRPQCAGCQACRPIRVLVDRFAETRSMRRVRRRNADVEVQVGPPEATVEKFGVYRRYLEAQHDDAMSRSFESFRSFLYASPTETIEFVYRVQGRIVGVSIADACPTGLSSVYMFFEPDEGRRSLGTFSVLHEIDCCRQAGWRYYYLGYWVDGCGTMSYKDRFRPNEVLTPEGEWAGLRA